MNSGLTLFKERIKNNNLDVLPAETGRTFIFVLSLILVFIIAMRPAADPDMRWHLRNGREIIENREILTKDIFSYTRYGTPWINSFWISEFIFYFLFRMGGLYAVSLFVAFFAVMTVSLGYCAP